jgi:hypothetical protein
MRHCKVMHQTKYGLLFYVVRWKTVLHRGTTLQHIRPRALRFSYAPLKTKKKKKKKNLTHVNNYLEISKKVVCSSLHEPVHVTNIDAPSHKLFQISKYRSFCGVLRSLLSHRVQFHQNIYGVHRNTMLHLSIVCLVNMNTPVCTFTNTLCKNISYKGNVPCTLTTQCVVCTLTHHPTSYMIFFSASLNRRVSVFMFTSAPPRKVTRYEVHPVNLQVTP